MTVAAVGSQQSAGLIDDLSGLVGHVVVVDADVTRVTLVAEDLVLDILPGAASIQAAQLLFADVGVTLVVDDIQSLLQFCLLRRILRHKLFQLVAKFCPRFAAAHRIKQRVGNLQLILHIVLQGEGTVGGQLLVAGNGTLDGGETDDLDDLHTAGRVGHDLTGDIHDALQHIPVLAELRVQHGLRQWEVDIKGILVTTEDAGAVVGLVLRHMCQHGIILLQLSGTPCEIWHFTHHRNKRFGFRFRRWRNYDDRFLNGQHLRWTTWNIINEIQCRLWHGKHTAAITNLLSAMNAGISPIFRITYGDTRRSLEIPIAAQRPGITIENTQCHHITLSALIAHRLIQAKGELHIAYIVVAVDQVCPKKVMNIHRIFPVADLRRQQQMTPFSGGLVTGGPRTIACRHPQRPMGRQADSNPKIRRQPSIIQEIITNGHVLCARRKTNAEKQHHRSNKPHISIREIHHDL